MSALYIHLPAYAQRKAELNQATNLTVYMSEQGSQHGPTERDRPLFSFLEKELNVKIDIIYLPWPRVLKMAEQGMGLVYGISKTQARQVIFNFSDPVFQHSAWLVTLCEKKFNYTGILDLKGKTISIPRDASINEEFDREAGKLFKLDFDSNAAGGRYTKLIMNRNDAVIQYGNTDAKTTEKNIRQYVLSLDDELLKQHAEKFCVIDNPVGVTDIRFGISKRLGSELLVRINSALAKAKRKRLLPHQNEN